MAIAAQAAAASAAPADSANAKTPDDRATEFQAVQGGGETRSGTTLLVEAYAVLWIILMAWLLVLWRRQAEMNRRIDQLDRVLDKAAAEKKK